MDKAKQDALDKDADVVDLTQLFREHLKIARHHIERACEIREKIHKCPSSLK